MKEFVISLAICLFSGVAFAQTGFFTPKDEKIARFEDDIVKFLIKEKQISDSKKDFNLEDYKIKFVVKKSLEIYLDTSELSVLLIRFFAAKSHRDIYWGLLTNDKCYLFYNLKDSNFLKFKRKYDANITNTVAYFVGSK